MPPLRIPVGGLNHTPTIWANPAHFLFDSFDIDEALAKRAPDQRESGNYRHAARHPIFDDVMAEAVTAGNMIDLQKAPPLAMGCEVMCAQLCIYPS